ncbi:hypothetical protein FOA52_004112 [Chlamydomonas sp. UWO 241]|nr:hypothetical protein FOA52_004112 [Chlamydomonas sp. UWO 241]
MDGEAMVQQVQHVQHVHDGIQAVGAATASTLAAIEALLADRSKPQDAQRHAPRPGRVGGPRAPAGAAGGAPADEGAGHSKAPDSPGSLSLARRDSLQRRHTPQLAPHGATAVRMGHTLLECPKHSQALELMGPHPELEFIAVVQRANNNNDRRSLDVGGAEAHHAGGWALTNGHQPHHGAAPVRTRTDSRTGHHSIMGNAGGSGVLDAGGSPVGARAHSRAGHPSIMDNHAGGMSSPRALDIYGSLDVGGSPVSLSRDDSPQQRVGSSDLLVGAGSARGGAYRRGSFDVQAGTGRSGVYARGSFEAPSAAAAGGGGLRLGDDSGGGGAAAVAMRSLMDEHGNAAAAMKEQLQRLTGAGAPVAVATASLPRRGSIDAVNVARSAHSRRSFELSRLPVYQRVAADASHAGGMGAMQSLQSYVGAGASVGPAAERTARSRRSLEAHTHARRAYEDAYEGRLLADAAEHHLPALTRGHQPEIGGLLAKLGLVRGR